MTTKKQSSILLPKSLLANESRLRMDASSIAADIHRHFNYTLGCDKYSVSTHHVYEALVVTLRDRLMERWKSTHYSYEARGASNTSHWSF